MAEITKKETDHEGRPIADDEPDDAQILVWCVSPHPGKPGYDLLERSWQRMLEYVRGELDCMLERCDIEDLEHDPFELKFSVQQMRKSDYLDEIAED